VRRAIGLVKNPTQIEGTYSNASEIDILFTFGLNRYPQYYDSDVFLFFSSRTPQHAATRAEFTQTMRIERSDT
jgi:hypothetical protein